MASLQEILVEVAHDGEVSWMTLNQPDKRNALSIAMMSAIEDTLSSLFERAETKAIVLAAKGPAFCAGHDLRELTQARQSEDAGLEAFRNILTQCSCMMQTIVTGNKPVIACVQGIATAAGCQLVASCDLAVASSEARFATPGVNLGLFCSTPMVALSRNVSSKHAMEMLLTGDMTSADDAARMGLINKHVPLDQLKAETGALAHKIASKSHHAIKVGKEAFYKQLELPLSEAYLYASEVMAMNMLSENAQEGVSAFFDKRSPVWPNEK